MYRLRIVLEREDCAARKESDILSEYEGTSLFVTRSRAHEALDVALDAMNVRLDGALPRNVTQEPWK